MDEDKVGRVAITGIIYKPTREYLLLRDTSIEMDQIPPWTVLGGDLDLRDIVVEPNTDISDYFSRDVEKLIASHVLNILHSTVADVEYLYDPSDPRLEAPLSVLSFYARYESGTPQINPHIDIAWVKAEHLATYALEPEILEELQTVDDILRLRESSEAEAARAEARLVALEQAWAEEKERERIQADAEVLKKAEQEEQAENNSDASNLQFPQL